MKLWEIDQQIAAVAPIYGINSNGDIHFKAEANEEQKNAAIALMSQLIPQLQAGEQ